MNWQEAIQPYLDQLKPVEINVAMLEKLVSVIDLTRLIANDSDSEMGFFFDKAHTPFGKVAAVCIYPEFVRLAATQFAGSGIKVATVANFPHGDTALEQVLIEVNQAITEGAEEIDVVFPYPRYLAGEQQYAQTFIAACKAACGENVLLKVILETGALQDLAIIADASWTAISAGADFIKTSTGKISAGTSLEAAAVILLVIKHALPQLKKQVGIKVSGGIKTIEGAIHYMELTQLILGQKWLQNKMLRIGTSQLMDEILKNNIISN